MRIRPLVAAAVALGALGSAGPVAAAPPKTYRLDAKRTTQSYEATLSTPVLPRSPWLADPSVPDTADCLETSCDIKTLRLVLPKGTSWGQLKVSVMVPATLNAALVVYGQKNATRRYVDELWRRRDGEPPPTFNSAMEYPLEITLPIIPAGTYTVAVVDRAGAGRFRAKVEWTAHPPDRRR